MILIAYDGSEGAKAAIEAAGRVFPGQPAVVLSVWRSIAAAASASLIAIPAAVATQAYTEMDEEAQRKAVEQAQEGAQAGSAAGLEARPSGVLATEEIWRAIVRAAEESDAAVIVVGSRGRSSVTSALLGSVSNAVVHNAERPVLVVPR